MVGSSVSSVLCFRREQRKKVTFDIFFFEKWVKLRLFFLNFRYFFYPDFNNSRVKRTPVES